MTTATNAALSILIGNVDLNEKECAAILAYWKAAYEQDTAEGSEYRHQSSGITKQDVRMTKKMYKVLAGVKERHPDYWPCDLRHISNRFTGALTETMYYTNIHLLPVTINGRTVPPAYAEVMYNVLTNAMRYNLTMANMTNEEYGALYQKVASATF